MINNPGNLLALIALASWIPLVFFFFSRYRPAKAGAISILGAALFLPQQVAFKLPIFPDLDKVAIAVLSTLAATFILARRKFSAASKPFQGIDAIFLLVLAGDIGMWLTNTDTIVVGGQRVLPSLAAYDAVGNVVGDAMVLYGTFYAGRVLFSTLGDVIALLRVMFALGLVYAGLALIELRFSPQLHVWIYGFMQSDFVHAAREGGYRPQVFVANGLVFARFFAVSLIAGVVLWRLNLLGRKGVIALGVATCIFLVCKSLGALVMFLIFAPVVAIAAPTAQRRMGLVLAVFIASYPVARGLDWVPVDEMIELANSYNPERAASMNVRFSNEAELLERARERRWFGWGGYGRSFIYDEWGKSLSILDGEWIGTLGYRGILGFVGAYGLYLLPVFAAARRIKVLKSTEHALVLAAFALIAVFLALDTIPNAASGLPHFFFSGAVAGAASGFLREDQRLRRARARERQEQLAAPADPAAA